MNKVRLKRKKEQRGITLIALIITVVVLLVLAVVTIRSVQDGGIIIKAKDAKSEYVIAQEKEKITLATNQAYLAGNGVITKKDLRDELSNQFGTDLISIDDTSADFIQIKLKSGREYKVFFNGQVEVVEDTSDVEDPGETPPVGGEDDSLAQQQFDAEFAEWAATNLDENATEFEYGDYIYKLNKAYNDVVIPELQWMSNSNQGRMGHKS